MTWEAGTFCIYSLASAQVARDKTEPQRDSLAHQHADRAIDLLRQAVAKGWDTPHDIEHMKTDPDLDPIREHPDFQKLLKDKTPPAPDDSSDD